jgi:glycosyltransferase involved in cell wall biosynthesis
MDNLKKKRIKVLYLAGWYPNEEHAVSGIFIERHARSVSKYCDVAVLYIHLGEIEDKVDVAEEDGLFVVRVYRTSGKVLDKIVNRLAGSSLTSIIIHLFGSYQGLKIVKDNFGMADVVHLNVTFYLHLGFVALALKLLSNVPYIITEHHIGYTREENTFMQESFFVRWMIRFICRNADAITTVSKSLRDDMIRCGIKNTFYVIPNVIDCNFACNRELNENKKKIMLHISLLNDAQKTSQG